MRYLYAYIQSLHCFISNRTHYKSNRIKTVKVFKNNYKVVYV